MKRILTILCVLISATSIAQYNPNNFTVSNKSYGPGQAVTTDGRSWYWDGVNFVMRDYQSAAEANTYLNLSKYRQGHFPIFIHLGGTLNGNGTYTGGITQVWFYKDGTADGNLVRWYTDSTIITPKVDTIYRKNDSVIGFTINNGPEQTIIIRGTAAGGSINSLTLAAPSILFGTPINFSNSLGAWSGTMTLNNQNPNTFFAGPTSGSPGAPTMRQLVVNDLPINIPNGNLLNTSITFGIGTSGTSPNWSTASPVLGSSTVLNIPLVNSLNTGLATPTQFGYWNQKVDSITISNDSVYKWANGIKTLQGVVTGGGGGSGTVTNFVFTNGGGIAGVVTNSTTTPTLALSPAFTGLTFSNGSAFAAATVSSPLTYSAGTLGIQVANTSQSGAISNTDWNTFNIKQNAITLTTTGTTGAASFISNTLNIPQYQGQLTLTTTGASGAATLIGNTLNIPQYAGTTYTFNNGLTNTSGTVQLGGSLIQNTTLGTAGFNLLVTGLPSKATALGTDSVIIGDIAGKVWKLPVPSGGGGSDSGIAAGFGIGVNRIAANNRQVFSDTGATANSLKKALFPLYQEANKNITGNGFSTVFNGNSVVQFRNEVLIGDSISRLGTILSDNFQRSSIGANYISTLPAATITFPSSQYMQFSGGVGDFSNYLQLAEITGKNRWNVQIKLALTAVTSTSYGISIGTKSTNSFFGPQIAAQFTMDNTASGGLVRFWGGNATYALIGTPSSQMTLTSGDTLILTLDRSDNVFTATMLDQNTGVSRTATYTYPYASGSPVGTQIPNTGHISLFLNGGTENITQLTYTSKETKNSVMVIGNSIMTGYDATAIYKRWISLLFPTNRDGFELNGGPGDRSQEGVARLPDLAAHNSRIYLLNLGVNDAQNAVSTSTYSTNIDSIVRYLRANTTGTIYFMENEPNNSVLTKPYTDTLHAIATRYGITVVNIYDTLRNGTQWKANYNGGDGIHPSDSGHYIISYQVLQTIPSLYLTSPGSLIYPGMLPTTQQLDLVVRDTLGNFYHTPLSTYPTNETFQKVLLNGSLLTQNNTVTIGSNIFAFKNGSDSAVFTVGSGTFNITMASFMNYRANSAVTFNTPTFNVFGALPSYFLKDTISGNVFRIQNGGSGVNITNSASGIPTTFFGNDWPVWIKGNTTADRTGVRFQSSTGSDLGAINGYGSTYGTAALRGVFQVIGGNLNTAQMLGLDNTNGRSFLGNWTTFNGVMGSKNVYLLGSTEVADSLQIDNIQAGNSGDSVAVLRSNGAGKFSIRRIAQSSIGGGVTTVGAFSGSSLVNGASISTNTITFGPADATNPGMIKNTGSQTLGATLTMPAPLFTSLTSSGANDSVLTVDPSTGQVHRRSGTITINAANGLHAPTTDSIIFGGTFNQATTLATAGFAFSITGLPNKSSSLSTDSLALIDNAGKIWKTLSLPSGTTATTQAQYTNNTTVATTAYAVLATNIGPSTTITGSGTFTLGANAYNYIGKVDASGGASTITVSPSLTGQTIVIKRIDNSGNSCTISMVSGNIDGAANKTIAGLGFVTLYWDGTNAWIINN